YSVAVRYYGRQMLASANAEPNGATKLLQTIVGERPAPRKRDLVAAAFRSRVTAIRARFVRTPPPADGGALLKRLFLSSAMDRLSGYPQLRDALDKGLPPLGEHAAMFDFASAVNADVTRGIADAFVQANRDARFSGFFDAFSALAGQQFLLLPYYFALFHQNKERHLLRQITGRVEPRDPATLRIGLFTDTLDDTNGVARFIRDMAARAADRGRSLTVHTSVPAGSVKYDVPGRKNFEPLLSHPMPYYEQLAVNVPPVMSVLEWADRQQFDAVHISTPGPVGMCGYLVARMLRVPIVGTYHTDFPAYIDQLTGDHRIGQATVGYMKWLYGQMPVVLSRSKAYRFKLHDLGVADDRVRILPPAIDTQKFSPDRRDVNVWADHNVAEPRKLLYVGRVSTEKNLPLLVEAFRKLCRERRDTAVVVAGDGPYLGTMREQLQGLPAYFLGTCDDQTLVPLYAGADLFVFPSRTDTLGQVVMEAQACGLPAVVSGDGGPKEIVDDRVTGVVCTSTSADDWCTEIDALLHDDLRRERMARAATARAGRFDLRGLFDAFWSAHAAAVATPQPPTAADEEKPAAPPFVPASGREL
ncbi:MAG TPA: glycosyltransferase, partial [Tepidisphaeraceae bacterium]|nr:glycosyltransferase [Tepidisphaeraceae bacterium]